MALGSLARLLAAALLLSVHLARAGEPTPPTRLVDGAQYAGMFERDEMVLLAVLAPENQCGEPCFVVERTLGMLAEKMGDVITVATVSGLVSVEWPDAEMTVFERHNLTSAPVLMILPYGRKDMAKPIIVDAQTSVGLCAAGPKVVRNTLMQLMPDPVQRVTRHSFRRFLNDKDPYAHRVILFTHNKEVSPLYRRLCLDFDRRAVCGQVTVPKAASEEEVAKLSQLDRASVRLADKFSASELPALLVSPAPGSVLEGGQDAYTWERYSGSPKDVTAMRLWLDPRTPPVPVQRVRSPGDWDAGCTQLGGVCVLFVLDKTRSVEDQRHMMRLVAARSLVQTDAATPTSATVARAPLHYSWLFAQEQPAALDVLRAPAPPTVLAVNMKKRRVAALRGTFTEAAVGSFLDGVLDGTAALEEIDQFPRLETVKEEPSKPRRKGKGGTRKGKGGARKGKGGADKGKGGARKGKGGADKGAEARGKVEEQRGSGDRGTQAGGSRKDEL